MDSGSGPGMTTYGFPSPGGRGLRGGGPTRLHSLPNITPTLALPRQGGGDVCGWPSFEGEETFLDGTALPGEGTFLSPLPSRERPICFPSPGGRGLRGGGAALLPHPFSPPPWPSPVKGEGTYVDGSPLKGEETLLDGAPLEVEETLLVGTALPGEETLLVGPPLKGRERL